MSGSNSGSIAAIKYAEIERVGIHKHQTFVANLMEWIRTHADRDYWIAVQRLNNSATSSYRPIAFSSSRINLTLDIPYREQMYLVAFLLAEECIKAKSFKQL